MNQLSNPLSQGFSEKAERFIDSLFDQLFPSCTQLLNLSPASLQVAKRQWLLGFSENGITKIEQVERGMMAMRAKPNGYLPSVGEFIKACRVQDYHALGLPNPDELEQRFNRFLGFAKFDAHKFQYRSKAEYYLLKKLYEKYGKKSQSEIEKALPKLLEETADKVRDGFEFEDIPKMIPAKPSFYDKAKANKARDNVMAMMRGGAIND